MKPLDMKPDTRSQRWRDAEARCTASHADPADLAIVAEEQARWDAEHEAKETWRLLLETMVGKVVYHAATGALGRVAAVRMPGEYVSPANNQPVTCAVLELDNDHAITVKVATDVVVLSDGEAALAKGVQDILSATLSNAMVLGAKMGLRFEAVVLMVTAVLRHQANQIEAQSPPPDAL